MIWRLIKGVIKVVVALVVVVVLSAVVAVTVVETQCRPPSGVAAEAPSALSIEEPGYARNEANTYWTFPEWYIVYSYEDLGAALETKPPSAFPWFSQIAGYWRSFCQANRVAAALPGDHYEYKQMIYVIGLSYTFEFGIKGLYENTIGRLSEWLRGPTPAAEDLYEKAVVQEYGAFLNQVPWYEFPFMAKLDGVWRQMPLIGDSPIRNIERKFALSAEYLVKAGYARVIAYALAATSASADLQIMFVVRGDPASVLAAEPDVRLVRALSNGDTLLVAPRYRVFTNILKRLAGSGFEIVEIAGNRRILMTAIVPEGPIPAVEGSKELFALPLDARPGVRRMGFVVDVPELAPVLRAYAAAGVEVEHFYDY